MAIANYLIHKEADGSWLVELDGKFINLGKCDRSEAHKRATALDLLMSSAAEKAEEEKDDWVDGLKDFVKRLVKSEPTAKIKWDE